jgi:hypothetical protein
MNHDIKIQKYDHIDIYAKDRKCPICDGELGWFGQAYKNNCRNGCYYMVPVLHNDNTDTCQFYIFGYELHVWEEESGQESYSYSEIQVAKEIFYWKENDRYLMKILTDEE